MYIICIFRLYSHSRRESFIFTHICTLLIGNVAGTVTDAHGVDANSVVATAHSHTDSDNRSQRVSQSVTVPTGYPVTGDLAMLHDLSGLALISQQVIYYIYMHIYIYIYMHTCIYTYIYTYMCI